MASGPRYRVASVLGTIGLTVAAVSLANHPLAQSLVTMLPVVSNLQPTTYDNGRLLVVQTVTVAILLGALWPLFKPRPRRILDTITESEKRLFLATTALATVGYFDASFRLPRTTLLLSAGLLAVALPAFFLAIRRQPRAADRAVLVGDDPAVMAEILEAFDRPIIGFVAPPTADPIATGTTAPAVSDGGPGAVTFGELPRLGGLSRLDEVLVEHDVDTALLAFSDSDRAEFFGTLATCYDHGVSARVHRDHADSVLLEGLSSGEDIVAISLEPWDWQDQVAKRLFDVVFAGLGLLLLSPVMLVIAVAIKLDSPGPVLYSQERTAEFGETFSVYKFRSMVPEAEADSGARLSDEDAGEVDPRVTRVGHFLRRTHLDEIPQLWSILTGKMSVVGPRPERPELDADIQSAVDTWRQRWFVKPGLTGLAQIRGATGHEPERKLRYDMEYVRRQSFWVDLKIVLRQLWLVGEDVLRTLRGVDPEAEN